MEDRRHSLGRSALRLNIGLIVKQAPEHVHNGSIVAFTGKSDEDARIE